MHDSDHDLLIQINTKLSMSITQAEQRHLDTVKAVEGLNSWTSRLSERVKSVEDKQIQCDKNTAKLEHLGTMQNIGFGILITIQFGIMIWSHLVR